MSPTIETVDQAAAPVAETQEKTAETEAADGENGATESNETTTMVWPIFLMRANEAAKRIAMRDSDQQLSVTSVEVDEVQSTSSAAPAASDKSKESNSPGSGGGKRPGIFDGGPAPKRGNFFNNFSRGAGGQARGGRSGFGGRGAGGRNIFLGTRPCWFFKSARGCLKGGDCEFAHTPPARSLPNARNAPPPARRGPSSARNAPPPAGRGPSSARNVPSQAARGPSSARNLPVPAPSGPGGVWDPPPKYYFANCTFSGSLT